MRKHKQNPTTDYEMQSLQKYYHWREYQEVSTFLERYPFLLPLLREALDNIHRYFPQAHPFLEVVADPETVGEGQLVIFIAARTKYDEASARLDQLDADWWLDALEQAHGKLCIALEFL